MGYRDQLLFWQGNAQTIPDDVWTPVNFPTDRETIDFNQWTVYKPVATTVAAGSNGAVLPVGTINVASTAGFNSRGGYISVTIGGTERLVRYTGLTATSFTGCTLGVGTLTTGDAVAQANVTWSTLENRIGAAVAEIAWTSNATGVRGTRFRFLDGLFNFPGGSCVIPAVATPANAPLHVPAADQPSNLPVSGLTGNAVECYQNSGTVGGLATIAEALSAPRLVVMDGPSR